MNKKGCKQRGKRIFNVTAKQPSKDNGYMGPPVGQRAENTKP